MTRKKRITKLIAGVLSVVLVFGVLMFASPTEAQAISLNATDAGFYNLAYGANGETTFGAGSQIRVINHTRENKNKSDAVYKFDGAMNWEPVGETYVVWDGITDNTFYGVYPYNAEYNSFTIPTDQSGGVEDADWMTDDFTDNKGVGSVKFDFQHRLAKVTVNITEWKDEFGGTAQTVSEPKIYSKGTAMTATYGDSGVTITATGYGTAINPLVDGASYTAIVAPAKYDATDKFMTFTVNGQEMTVLAKPSSLTDGLQPGNHYTFNLTVGKDAVTLSSVTVSDWNKVDLDGGVAKECEHETTVNNGACAVCGKQVYVDLGLSVNWATVNIGATKPEEAGDFFAWGETEPKETFTKDNYTVGSKYNATDGKLELELADDAAFQNWGNGWRMPTSEEQKELLDADKCTWTWTTVNGVTGYQITSKVPGYEGNSIFLPFELFISAFGSTVLQSAYWSSSIYTNYNQWTTASDIWFHGSMHRQADQGRESGLLIRPVREK